MYNDATEVLAFWEEELSIVCQNGYYSAILGLESPLDTMDLLLAGAPHLGITISGLDELTPRLPIASVPYALTAAQAQTAADVNCEACIGPTEVGFAYAGSNTPGGPATDLECTADCISTLELSNAAVTNAKLGDNAVTSPKLAPASVTPEKLSACPAGQILRSTGPAMTCQTHNLVIKKGRWLLRGDIYISETTPTWTHTIPVSLPERTRAIFLAVYYVHGGANHGYLHLAAHQTGTSAEEDKAYYNSSHYNDYYNTDYEELTVPWNSALGNTVEINVTSSYNSNSENRYHIYYTGYIAD